MQSPTEEKTSPTAEKTPRRIDFPSSISILINGSIVKTSPVTAEILDKANTGVLFDLDGKQGYKRIIKWFPSGKQKGIFFTNETLAQEDVWFDSLDETRDYLKSEIIDIIISNRYGKLAIPPLIFEMPHLTGETRQWAYYISIWLHLGYKILNLNGRAIRSLEPLAKDLIQSGTNVYTVDFNEWSFDDYGFECIRSVVGTHHWDRHGTRMLTAVNLTKAEPLDRANLTTPIGIGGVCELAAAGRYFKEEYILHWGKRGGKLDVGFLERYDFWKALSDLLSEFNERSGRNITIK